ncbi:MAG: phenylacetate--CoA ligase family protein [Candidatus Hodarchaeota archaeon]
MLSRIKYLVRRQFFKAYYFLAIFKYFRSFKYFNFYREYLFIKEYIYKSIIYNQSIQKIRLFNLLNFSINNIPYYRKIARERNIKISKNTIFEDIKKFPILTKDKIRKNWKFLHVNLRKIKFKIATSGGTTGEPIKIIQDSDFFAKTLAMHLVSDEMANYFIGEKIIMLWGDEKEIIKNTRGVLSSLITKYARNIYFQNAFKMSDDIMLKYINEINQIKPKTIISYIQSIYELAKFIERKKLKIFPLNSIITTAGVLTNEVKIFLENIFGCKIFNRYGSRELFNLAMSCEVSQKLHINMYHQYIEILDDNENIVKEHEEGNIIITNLVNYGMPIIRYKIGDRGSLDFSQCPCGRGLIRLDNVFGRVVDVFKNEKGDLIDGEYFTHLFYFRNNIKKFQVIQEKINEININIVTLNGNQLIKSVEDDILEKIKIVMGNNCKINFNYVLSIDPSSSGKFRYTISKVP